MDAKPTVAKPKTLKYAATMETIEQRIVEALPEIADALIKRAKEGDLRAATYLVDRILGKAAGTVHAPAEDKRPPYSEEAFARELEEEESDFDIEKLLRG